MSATRAFEAMLHGLPRRSFAVILHGLQCHSFAIVPRGLWCPQCQCYRAGSMLAAPTPRACATFFAPALRPHFLARAGRGSRHHLLSSSRSQGPPPGSSSGASTASSASTSAANAASVPGPASVVAVPIMAETGDPSPAEASAVRSLVVHKLPDACVDGGNFALFTQFWAIACAQLSKADLLVAVGGADGATDPSGTAKHWKLRQSAAHLFSCIADTPTFPSASAHIQNGYDMRNCIFENCCPAAMVEREVLKSVACSDCPRHAEANHLAWFRKIHQSLHVNAHFTVAKHVGANFETLKRSEAHVVDALQRPPADGRAIVPRSEHVTEKVENAKCDALEAASAIVAKANRCATVAGTVINGGHMPSVRGAATQNVLRANSTACVSSGCQARHEPAPSERIILARERAHLAKMSSLQGED